MRVFDACESCMHAVVATSLDSPNMIPLYDDQGNVSGAVECRGLSKRIWPHCKAGEDVFSAKQCERFAAGLPRISIQPLLLVPTPRV